MKRVIIITGSALFLIAALSLAHFIIPTTSYKNLLKNAAIKHLGVEAQVGKISVYILPQPHFKIENISILSPEKQFKSNPIMTIGSVSGNISLLDLMKNIIKTDLEIRNADINYVKKKDRATNLDVILANLKNPITEDPLKKWDVTIKNVSMYDGRLAVHNEENETSTNITIPKLLLSGLKNTKNLSGYLTFLFNVKESSISASSGFFFNYNEGMLHLRKCKMSIDNFPVNMEISFDLSKKPLDFELHAVSPSIGLESLGVLLPPLSGGLPAGISISGLFSLDLYIKKQLDHTFVRFQSELTRSNVTIGNMFAKPQGREMRVGFAGTDTSSHIQIDALNLRFQENLIQISGSVIHDADHQAQLNLSSNDLDISTLQNSVPVLSLFGPSKNASLNITIQGSLDDPSKRIVTGKLSAKNANVFGQDVRNLSLNFLQSKELITLPHISADVFGGTVSANGKINMLENNAYEIQTVFAGIDGEKTSPLMNLVKGKGDLVLTLKGSGKTVEELKSQYNLLGTFTSNQADIFEFNLGRDLFTSEMTQILESTFKDLKINSNKIKGLQSIGGEANNLKIAFKKTGNELSVTDLRFDNSKYTLWLKGLVGADGVLNSTGSIWLNKSDAASIIPDVKILKAVTNASSDLQIPFALKGSGSAFLIRLEAEAFKNVLEGNFSPTPTVKEIAADKKEEPAKKIDTVKKQQPKAKKPTPKVRPKRTPKTTQSSEDIFKVIIK